MIDNHISEGGSGNRYQFRRHLSTIQSQVEYLLNSQGAVNSSQRDALRKIERSCYELTAILDHDPASDQLQSQPAADAPQDIHRILVYRHNEYLSNILEVQPNYHGGIELVGVSSIDEARGVLQEQTVDYVLIDAVWDDSTGIDLMAELSASQSEMPPYALISLYSDETTPVALALSGIISPNVSSAKIDEMIQPFVDEPETATIAGYLTEQPGDALNNRVTSCSDSTFGDVAEVESKLRDCEVHADVVCLDLEVYRRLPPRVVGRLRTVSPGRGRPLIVVAPTDADPYGRTWIPTLGSRQFLHCPPDLVGLISQILAQQWNLTPNSDS